MKKKVPFKEKCPHCFKALSVPARAKIYKLILEKGSVCVSEIVQQFKLTQPTISYHLRDMKEAGLLKSNKMGRKVMYEVSESCPYDEEGCLIR